MEVGSAVADSDGASVGLLDWGTVEYAEALERQTELFDTLTARKESDARGADGELGAGWLVMCEHPHVYTLGRSGKSENLLVSEAFLRSRGATLHRTGRGGDITYHGPGQLVCYPILDLDRLGLGLREYVGALEQAVIETVEGFLEEALGRERPEVGRVKGKTGVWLTGPGGAGGGERKICAIGVRASRGVVMHGLALNVATGLEWFALINPCGMAGSAVTSVERETGRVVALAEVKRRLAERLAVNLKIENIKI